MYCSLPRTEWIFLIFEGWFLKALQAVLFHATATHCYHGRDIVDALFLFWKECYRFAPNSKFHSATKDREMNVLKHRKENTQDEEFIARI